GRGAVAPGRAPRAGPLRLVGGAEKALPGRSCPAGEVRVVANGVDLDYFRPRPKAGGEAGCVFVGALDYLPNVDAARWFVAEVWPGLRRAVPGAALRLVGRRPTRGVSRLAAVPGVEGVGQLAGVRAYRDGAAVAVVA